MTTKEILIAAREKVAHAWCQADYERNGHVCAYGAISRACDKSSDPDFTLRGAARDALRDAIGQTNIESWNDRAGRTQAEVLAAFNQAIEAQS